MNNPVSPNSFSEKEMFEVVKYFKDIYTTINMGEEVYLFNGNIFYKNDPYFLLYGELESNDANEFTKWANGKAFTLKLSELNSLRECLKKNVISMNFNSDKFELKYKDKSDTEIIFSCENKSNANYDEIVKKIKITESTMSKELPLKEDIFNSEILEIYLDDTTNKITTERNKDKLLEVPTKRILSNQKNSLSRSIRFSDKDDSGKRFVRISSKSEKITLHQLYATI
jgi:hypothetical protein